MSIPIRSRTGRANCWNARPKCSATARRRLEIFNTDQGSQFTSNEFTGLLKGQGIQISMDGKGCRRDNVFVERLWRSVKYEEVYLKAYDSVSIAKTSLGTYLNFYNTHRPHQSLDGNTPDTIYFTGLPQESIAA
ncbi:protein of unknown function [Georgfuchsia toluolica]|uniref:Integrase catalytic domain-containing protein n=1 Tax=Georgfuchsia toluolica TaxID=424218 RepID=A0A916JA27_9PROT|nr:protein of unknown function [Georgfuchsia toluolica]